MKYSIEEMLENTSINYRTSYGKVWDVAQFTNIKLIMQHPNPIKYIFQNTKRWDDVYKLTDRYFRLKYYKRYGKRK